MIKFLISFIPAPYRMGAALLAAIVVVGGIWTHGYRTSTNHNRVASMRIEISQLKKKVSDTDAILKAANQRATQAETQGVELRKSIDAFQATLKPSVSRACSFSDADIRRLRNIAVRASGRAARRTP